jgi:hypothetical protein
MTWDGEDLPVLQTEGLAYDQHISCQETSFQSEKTCVDTGADTALSRNVECQGREQGGTSSRLTTDSPIVFERIWKQLDRACKILDSGGRDLSEDCKQNKMVMYNAFPLCPQPNPDAMVPKSPLESPETEDMYIVIKDNSAAVGGSNIIIVDNSASPWTFNPNSMESGKTVKLETYFEGNEMLLRVRQSSLKRRKGAKGESASSERVTIWMYNRVINLHGSNDRKVEEDIWIGMVKQKQASKGHSDLVTVDDPRKRYAPQNSAPLVANLPVLITPNCPCPLRPH